MIIGLMVYTSVVSLLVGLAALAIEGSFALLAWPRRGVWIIAMVLSLSGAAIMTFGTHAFVPHGSKIAPASLTISAAADLAPPAPPGEFRPLHPLALASPPVSATLERYAKGSWLTASILLLGLYGVGALHLWRSARNWPRRTIGDVEVVVTHDLGPAVLGVIRPAIVVPRWLVEEATVARDAALSHERQHIAAHDPAVLTAALLLLVLTPWNLPLWWQLRRLKLAIEVDCDARVLATGLDRKLYANTLLAIIQHAGRLPIGAVAIAGRASQTERRIRAMMSPRPRHVRLWVATLAAAALPLLVVAAELDPPAAVPPARSSRSAHLGIGIADLDVNAASTAIAAKRYRGVIVTAVHPGDVADRAGVKRGDVITQFGDTPIISMRTLMEALAQSAPDARTSLVILRGTQHLTVKVDFSTALPPQAPSKAAVIDATDWDALRDAAVPISEPQLRDELIRMSRLEEMTGASHRLATLPINPNTSIYAPGPRITPVDVEANVRRLQAIIAQHGWPTVSMVGFRGSQAAAMIALSARNDPAFQAQVLLLMEPLLQRDEVAAASYSWLYDVVKTPQRYGTDMECVKGLNQPSKPVEEPEHLAARRAALGLPPLPQFCKAQVEAKNSP